MASRGIRDRVAIVGMGCTNFGEHWDQLGRRPAHRVVRGRHGIGRRHRATTSTPTGSARMGSGVSGLTLSPALRLENKPVTRLENMCATGSEAFRNACYAVASGRVRRGHGHRRREAEGLRLLRPGRARSIPTDGTLPETTAPARVQPARPGLRQEVRRRRGRDEGRAHPHRLEEPPQRRPQPPAQFRKEVAKEIIPAPRRSPAMLGIFDCSGVSDGSAAAIVVRAEDAHRYTDKPLYVKGLSFVAGPARGNIDPRLRLHDASPRWCARPRTPTAQAGVQDPRAELAMAEVHDCFTPDRAGADGGPRLRRPGLGWKEVLAGTFDLDGELPVNPDGGLKAFGHPIGASGLRMMFECWLQLRGEAPEDAAHRQRRPAGRDLGPHPQPRRPARRVRQLRLGRRHRAERLSDPVPDADNVRIGAAYAAAMRGRPGRGDRCSHRARRRRLAQLRRSGRRPNHV